MIPNAWKLLAYKCLSSFNWLCPGVGAIMKTGRYWRFRQNLGNNSSILFRLWSCRVMSNSTSSMSYPDLAHLGFIGFRGFSTSVECDCMSFGSIRIYAASEGRCYRLMGLYIFTPNRPRRLSILVFMGILQRSNIMKWSHEIIEIPSVMEWSSGLVDEVLGLADSPLGFMDSTLGLVDSTLGLVDSTQDVVYRSQIIVDGTLGLVNIHCA